MLTKKLGISLTTDGTSTTGSPTVINGGGGANMFIYTSPSMGGATFTAAYQNHGGAAAAESYTDFAIAFLQRHGRFNSWFCIF